MEKISSHVKLILPQADENAKLQQSLLLEVWGIKKLYHFGYPFEPGVAHENRSHYSLLVKSFTQMYWAEH